MINTNATRMLQNICTKFAHKLSVLIVNLDLVCWGTLSDNEITSYTINRNPKIQKL